jgi:hypothetical protein
MGLYMLPSGPDGVRAVFYLDISPSHVESALEIVRKVLPGVVQTGRHSKDSRVMSTGY